MPAPIPPWPIPWSRRWKRRACASGDTQQIDSCASIQRTISQGLARSKLLLALYSQAYSQRRACDWELAAAYVAGAPDRILVLNPEDGADHIQPQSLREHRFANREDLSNWAGIAAKVKAQAAIFTTTFGALPKPAPDQKWVGLSPNGGAQNFVGRRAEIWRVHDGLAAGSVLLAPTTAGTAPGDGSTLLRGLGGMGKTLLAEEYARRFAAAWPGGIFWLKANATLTDQYLMLASELGASFDPADPSSLKRAVTQAMAARTGAYLWVVDDLPHGLNAEQARAWFAPTNQGRTLVTTRTRTLDRIAKPVELAELGADEAFRLLTLDRKPQNPMEEETARAIVEALGRHALAVDLARHLVTLQSYDDVLADLQDPSEEALSLAAEMELELPTGHEKSITQTFLRSIQSLKASALDALHVAAHLAPHTAIPTDLLAAILGQADTLTEKQAKKNALLAVNQNAAHSLCDINDSGYVVHALVCRTMALRYGDSRSQSLEQAALAALRTAFQQAHDIRQHGALAPLLPHAHALCQAITSAAHADLAGWLGRYYYEAGLYAAAREQMSLSLETNRHILGPDHPATLTSMNNLASTLKAQGDHTGARDLREQVLETSRRILGPDHPDTRMSGFMLAQSLAQSEEWAKALELAAWAAEGGEAKFGPDHPYARMTAELLTDLTARQNAAPGPD